MEYQLHIQDPAQASTRYLFEAMVDAADSADSWQGMFAFASCHGVTNLFSDPTFEELLSRKSASLIVGIDAVTNRKALELLKQFENQFAGLSVRVFWNETSKLFHPKLSLFEYAGGAKRLIVGSGNLTPGGLAKNHEAYSVVKASAGEELGIQSLHSFLASNSGAIRPIDDDALERAAKNIIRGKGKTGPRTGGIVEIEDTPDDAVEESSRVLIAYIPKGDKRWAQVHLNQEVVKQFFQIKPNSSERAFQRERRLDGTLADPDPPRKCVYSKQSNKNLKIEMLAAKAAGDYPRSGRPIGVYLELGARTFEYLLLLPGKSGHGPVEKYLMTLPKVGKGLHRSITTLGDLRKAWPKCPFPAH